MEEHLKPSGAPLRVTSLNPVRDANTIGHGFGTSRTVQDAKSAALHHRFIRLLADGESAAAAADERGNRIAELLNELQWAYDGIAEDMMTLEAGTDGLERRDQLLREAVDELATMAELSTGKTFSAQATWSQALGALHVHLEELIASPTIDAIVLADIDLCLERIEHVEQTVAGALRSYLGYLNA